MALEYSFRGEQQRLGVASIIVVILLGSAVAVDAFGGSSTTLSHTLTHILALVVILILILAAAVAVALWFV